MPFGKKIYLAAATSALGWALAHTIDPSWLGLAVACVVSAGSVRVYDAVWKRNHARRARIRASTPLANISHEIRTPLNGILGLTQLLLKSQPSAAQREHLDAIKSSGQSLLGLVNDILDFSTIESGRDLYFDRKPFSIRRTVRDTVKAIAPAAHARGVETAFNIDRAVPMSLIGDPNRLRQVLTNLLANAVKFTERGEIAVDVTMGSPRANSVALCFTVTDTGMGVPLAERAAIFDRFHQIRDSDAHKGGVGLGLAIAQQIVRQMGGTIGLVDDAREGATFRFEAVFDRDIESAAEPPSVSIALPPGKVLVLEHSDAQRAALADQLERWGFDVVATARVPVAMTALADQAFSLLLLDAHVPDVNVWDVADALRAFDQVPAILMARCHLQVDNEKLRAHGFVGQLTKPLAPEHLGRAIQIVLQGVALNAPEDVETANMNRLEIGGIRVLLADDDAINRTVAHSILTRAGAHVTTASNGREALELFGTKPFDVGVVDLQMPELDGVDLAKTMRQTERGSGRLPLLAVTAHASEDDKARALAAGIDAFLSKPFDEDDLIHHVRELVHKSKKQARAPIDVTAALNRASGDASLLAELAKLFLGENASVIDALASALDARNFESVERMAHRLKGSLLTLSASAAADAAFALETSAKDTSVPQSGRALERLRIELERLEPELQSLSESSR